MIVTKARLPSSLLAGLLCLATSGEAASGNIFQGALAADLSYGIDIDNTAAASPTGITIYYLGGGGRRSVAFEILTVPAATRATYVQAIPKGTRRTAIEVAPPRNVAVELEITQGTSSFRETCDGGCTLIFDVQ